MAQPRFCKKAKQKQKGMKWKCWVGNLLLIREYFHPSILKIQHFLPPKCQNWLSQKMIFWKTPFGFVDRYNLTVFEKAVFDPGYQATERYIIQGRNHLKPYGRLLIGFSTTLGRFDLLQKFLQQSGFTVRLAAKPGSMESPAVFFELFEA